MGGILNLLGAAQLILTCQLKKLRGSEQSYKTNERKHLCGKMSVKISFYTIVNYFDSICFISIVRETISDAFCGHLSLFTVSL